MNKDSISNADAMHFCSTLAFAAAPATATLYVLLAMSATGAVRYVDVNSASPTPPYTNWATAATIIQNAVDAAVTGDEIVVTNGVYQTGGRAVYGTMTNRVAVTKPLTVQSVNGPEVTVIRGNQVPGTTDGDGAVRCVYLTNGAALVGFTLTNGATRVSGNNFLEGSGGGVWCESGSAVASNCVLTGNSAYIFGGGAYGGTLNNCTFSGNSGSSRGARGGGVYGGTLNDCTLSGNSANGSPYGSGGGAADCALNNCTLTGNAALGFFGSGGGADQCTLRNCTLSGNSAGYVGGGASGGTLNNCALSGNSADAGGGAAGSTLNNCTLSGNSAHGFYGSGGGASGGTLNNCTLTGNSATNYGGGVAYGTLNNCIVYFNTSTNAANYYQDQNGGILNYCCSTPLPTNGVGNITNEPAFVDLAKGNLRLRPNSPCIDAGTNLSAIITNDLDGRTRPLDGDENGTAAFDMGAYEYRALHVWQESPSPTPPYGTWATAATNIQDAVDVAVAGDEILVTNGVYQAGGRAVVGTMTNRVAVTKPLTLRSVNGPAVTVIQGYRVPGTTDGDGAVRCVYLTNGAALVGFTLTNGATRAIGDDFFEQSGGGVWCDSVNAVVADCVLSGNLAEYGGGGAYGATLNNCTLDGNRATGPIGSGGGAYASTLSHCSLTGNMAGYRGGGAFLAVLNNCTLNTNSAVEYGGGASECTLINCTVRGNSAEYGGGTAFGLLNRSRLTENLAEDGGGSYYSDLNNCILTGNSAEDGGGGAYNGTLNNCTLTGNTADYGGGAAYGGVKGFRFVTLNNCIVYSNTVRSEGANYQVRESRGRTILNHCCTTPITDDDFGSFTNAPLFVEQASGNLRLQSNSPCINAGRNAYAPAGSDLDGNPRIAGGTVDVGAYEFQSPQSTISYDWLLKYGLPTDGSADSTDPDGDQMTNWQEWRASTNPNDPLSLLRLLPPVPFGPDLFVSWQSAFGVSYFLERSTNLTAPLVFTPLATNLFGQPGVTIYPDPNAARARQFFYRVGVE